MPELLARLTVRAQNVGERSNGGTGGITPQDIAAACAGMTHAQYLLILRIYTHDTSVQSRLFYLVYDQAMTIATRGRWRLPAGKELVRKMVGLALAEIIEPVSCHVCGGKCEVWLKGMSVPTICKDCKGTGKRAATSRHRAAALELDESTFAKYWRDRYEQIYAHVRELDSDGLRKIKKRLLSES